MPNTQSISNTFGEQFKGTQFPVLNAIDDLVYAMNEFPCSVTAITSKCELENCRSHKQEAPSQFACFMLLNFRFVFLEFQFFSSFFRRYRYRAWVVRRTPTTIPIKWEPNINCLGNLYALQKIWPFICSTAVCCHTTYTITSQSWNTIPIRIA